MENVVHKKWEFIFEKRKKERKKERNQILSL